MTFDFTTHDKNVKVYLVKETVKVYSPIDYFCFFLQPPHNIKPSVFFFQFQLLKATYHDIQKYLL